MQCVSSTGPVEASGIPLLPYSWLTFFLIKSWKRKVEWKRNRTPESLSKLEGVLPVTRVIHQYKYFCSCVQIHRLQRWTARVSFYEMFKITLSCAIFSSEPALGWARWSWSPFQHLCFCDFVITMNPYNFSVWNTILHQRSSHMRNRFFFSKYEWG